MTPDLLPSDLLSSLTPGTLIFALIFALIGLLIGGLIVGFLIALVILATIKIIFRDEYVSFNEAFSAGFWISVSSTFVIFLINTILISPGFKLLGMENSVLSFVVSEVIGMLIEFVCACVFISDKCYIDDNKRVSIIAGILAFGVEIIGG